MQRQARLSGATGPGKGNEGNARSRDERGQFRELCLSADQRVRLGGQIRGAALKAHEGREPVWEVRANHLPDLLRLEYITQLVATEVAQSNSVRELTIEEATDSISQQNLATVTGGQQTCQSIERRGEVVPPVIRRGFASMQCHPYTERPERIGPWFGGESALTRDCGSGCV
jgi:hypothetical protein